MTKYRVVLDIQDDETFKRFMKQAGVRSRMIQVSAVVVETDGTEAPVEPKHLPWGGFASSSERNAEIVRLYSEDPVAYPSTRLSEMFQISRERVCQILRPVNAIGLARERRAIAKEALQEAREAQKAAVAAELESRMEEALVLIRGGASIRKAASAVGLGEDTHFRNLLGQRARLAGIPAQHGRWRDFSERKARIEELVLKEGMSITGAIHQMNSEGDRINYAWVQKHCPNLPRSSKGRHNKS